MTSLRLFGAPGTLDHLPALTSLVRLDTLWLCDLFGYPAEDFPGPGELPALVSLDLDSIPVGVAIRVCATFKQNSRVNLTIRKPRKPEWLARNINNPLRHWDGQGDVTAVTAKKASVAFISALHRVREANPAAPDFTASVTCAIEALTVGLPAHADARSNRLWKTRWTTDREPRATPRPHTGKTPVERYRSPRSHTMNATVAPDTSLATSRATAAAPPEEIPAKIPS